MILALVTLVGALASRPDNNPLQNVDAFRRMAERLLNGHKEMYAYNTVTASSNGVAHLLDNSNAMSKQ
jgi:hypothetical protein